MNIPGHDCTLADELCDIYHGWDRIMDYIVATKLPAMIARPIDVETLTGRK